MRANTANTPPLRRWLILLLKIAVTVACLWYVFSQIDLQEIWQAMKSADIAWLIAAFAVYTLSKLTGAKRLNIYFSNIGIHLPEWQNIKLYWLGMFYNLFLPGAVTGDAYKVILLSKRFDKSYKKTTAAVLLDRISGLLSLGLLLSFYSAFVLKEKWIIVLLIAGAILAVPVFYLITRKFFPDFLKGFFITFFLGILVQLTVLACLYCVMLSLNINNQHTTYVFIFLAAVIASVLPISVGGGLGIREFVMIEGVKYAGLGETGQHAALIVSLLFYLVTVVCSLIGMIYVFKDPLAIKNNKP